MLTAEAPTKIAQDASVWFPLTEDGSRLSHQLGVRALKKNETVKYKLIESDKDDPSRTEVNEHLQDTGRRMKKTPGYTMVGKKEIFDSIAGRTVTITNKVLRKNIKTPLGDVQSTRPESIKFLSDKPVVEVKWYEPEKYAFLERANENIDNPFRDPSVSAKYYRVDPRKKIEKEAEKDAFEFRAMKWVQEEATFEQLISCAIDVNKHRQVGQQIKTDYKNSEAQLGFSTLKRVLFDLAKSDPKSVIKGSTNKAAIMEIQMRDAETWQLIMFYDGKEEKRKNTWFHNDTNLTEICQIDIGKNKYEGLLSFLATDEKGKLHYTKIIESLATLLSPR
jgi:hypothetical protein